MIITEFERGQRETAEFFAHKYKPSNILGKLRGLSCPRSDKAERKRRFKLVEKAIRVTGSQYALAKALGTHSATITRWRSGENCVSDYYLDEVEAIAAGRVES